MIYYFAYGSNMLPAQMAERCPGAKLVGPAQLSGWRFLISTRGTANIVPQKDAIVFGALWRCTPFHLHYLDQYEGVSYGFYLRRHVRINALGKSVTANVYWAARHAPGPARTHYLTTALLPGAEALGLPDDYVQYLQSWLSDPPIGRYRARYRGRRKK